MSDYRNFGKFGFGERFFVYEDPPEVVPPRRGVKSKVDVDIDSLLQDSSLHLEGVAGRDLIQGEIKETVTRVFAEMGTLEISENYENLDGLQSEIQTKFLSYWEVHGHDSTPCTDMNLPDFRDPEKLKGFSQAAAALVIKMIKEDEAYKQLQKDLEAAKADPENLKKLVATRVTISVLVDQEGNFVIDVKRLETEVEEVKKTLEDVKKAVEDDKEKIKKQNADIEKEKGAEVKALVEAVIGNKELMAGIFGRMTTEMNYNDLETKLREGVASKAGYFELQKNLPNEVAALVGAETLNFDKNAAMAVFKNKHYERYVHGKIVERLKREIDAELKEFKDVSAIGFELDPEVLKKFKTGDSGFKIEINKDGSWGLNIPKPEEFKKAYDKAKDAIQEENSDIKEAKKGLIGWILRHVFGIKGDAWNDIVGGEHPLSYFYGMISVASGGTVYKWAYETGVEGLEAMDGNETLKANKAMVMALAAKMVPMAPNPDKNPATRAAPKLSSKIKDGIEGAGDDFVTVDEEKGIRFNDTYKVGDKEKFFITIARDQEVIFGGAVDSITKDGNISMEQQTRLTEPGEYVIIGRDIPMGTYFSKGVKYRAEHEEAEAEKK